MIKSIVIVGDAYPPVHTSAALQLKDLASEFLRQGIQPTVISSDAGLNELSVLKMCDGINVLRLKTPEHKRVGKIRRTIAEFLMPFYMIRNFKKSNLAQMNWDAIIWYSPTIFLGPFIWYLKRKSDCPSYLILRDIFPAWALDLGLIKKGVAYYFFKFFEKLQYQIADCIGVQSYGNLKYFEPFSLKIKKIEVLNNWLTPKPITGCSISVSNTAIAGRKIFVYAGNMGIAQGMGDLLLLAEALISRSDIGFLFVGRGSDLEQLKSNARNRALHNVVFFDEINSEEIPGLYAQCHVGLIALDVRHKTHNIPGKFLSYLQSGLPVMAIVNDGNDIIPIIENFQVGRVTTERSNKKFQLLAESILEENFLNYNETKLRCAKLASEMFSSQSAVKQIIESLNAVK